MNGKILLDRVKSLKRYFFFCYFSKIILLSFSKSNSKTFLLLKFLSRPFLKSTFRSLKWGFFTLIRNFVLDFLILKLNFSHNFRTFQKGYKNCKNENVFEFDVEKNGGIIINIFF